MSQLFAAGGQFKSLYKSLTSFPGGACGKRTQAGKNPPANAGDIKDSGLIPGWGRSLEEGMATHFSILQHRVAENQT